MQAKYTFFEAAQQHGYVVALMVPRMLKSREHYQIIIDPGRGRVFQLFRSSRPDVPHFEYVIPERDTMESQDMWRRKVAKTLEGEWRKHERRLLEAREARLVASGGDTTVASELGLYKTESSSTGVPPSPVSSNGPLTEVGPATPASVPEPSTPESSPTGPISSTPSGPPSRRSGSRSRSSSGASKVSSG